ncbi:MAG: PAS domain S-box protein, partial [Planctomycetes bacterium]|nr:PAS domain S-box protein [Planctomycetota bacterium]
SNKPPACKVTLEEIIQSPYDGVIVFDGNREVVLFSAACEQLMGVDRTTVLGKSCACDTAMNGKDERARRLDDVLCPASRIFDREIDDLRQRISIAHPDGRRVLIETSYTPIRGEGESVGGVVGIMRDITHNGATQDEGGPRSGSGENVSTGATLSDETMPGGAHAGSSTESGAMAKMGPLDLKLSVLERTEILTALQETGGQRTLAAQRLGISRSRLYRRPTT